MAPLSEAADPEPRGLSPRERACSIHGMATGALRTIAFALRDGLTELKTYSGPSHPDHALLADPSNFAKIESGMTFLGLVGILERAACGARGQGLGNEVEEEEEGEGT